VPPRKGPYGAGCSEQAGRGIEPRKGERCGEPTVSRHWQAAVLSASWRVRRTPPGSDVAADKAFISRVQVPSYPWLDSGMERYHRSCRGTTRPWRGVNGLAALWPVLQLGTTGGP
jgi:hypothetical protein